MRKSLRTIVAVSVVVGCVFFCWPTVLLRYTQEFDLDTGEIVADSSIIGKTTEISREPSGLSKFLSKRNTGNGRLVLRVRPLIGRWRTPVKSEGYEALIAVLAAQLETDEKGQEHAREIADSFMRSISRGDFREAQRIVAHELREASIKADGK